MLKYLFCDNGIVGHTQKGGKGIIASAFCLINSNCDILKENCEIEKDVTNNYGELKAIRNGINESLKLGVKNIKIYSDSEIAVKCLNGEYSVSSEVIKPVYSEIKELIKKFDGYEIVWINRDLNMYADYLTACALDKFRKNKKEIIDKNVCLKQLKDFVTGLKPIEIKPTGFKDIDLFNPEFIRTERETINYQTDTDYNENIIFDYKGGDYLARDKEKYGLLNLNEYRDTIDKQRGFISYHISLRSADNKRALLVFESDDVKGQDVIIKLAGLVKEKGIKFILKDSANRSLHLVIPVLCNDKQEFERLFNSILYLLGEKDRALIDLQLNNIDKQVRGFESLHLKTYDKSVIKSGSLDNLNINLCSENTKNINTFSLIFQKLTASAGVTSVMGKGGARTSFLFESIELNRQEQLLEVIRNLKKGERSVCLTYIASKLKNNEENKAFFEKLVKSVKDKREFNVNEELQKGFNVFEKGYSKKLVDKTEHGPGIVKALYGYARELNITRGIKEVWDDYKIRVSLIEDAEKRERKIKECEEARAFLEERGFLEFILDARNGIQIYHSLRLMENSGGLKITRENYNVLDLGNKENMLKGELAESGLYDFNVNLKEVNEIVKKELENKNMIIEFKPEIPKPAKNDYGEFGLMNKGNKKFTKIYYDIETDFKQEPCLIGVYNKDLKRIVLAQIVKEIRLKEGEQKLTPRFEKSYKDDFEIIKCEVLNGYEAVFLADCESYLACVCNSLMRQGDKTPSILKEMIKGVDINFNYFSEIYNNKRRSLWIAHNSNFDINKLNLTAKKGLVHIDSSGVKVEDIVINTFGNKKRYLGYLFNPDKNLNERDKWSVNYKLGNRNVGVYFKASTQKYGLWEKPEIELKPIQKESDNYVYGLDSVLIARALQKKSASLKSLGEEYDLEVKKAESEYNFKGGELWSNAEKDVKEIEYLIKDLFVTDYVFRELTKELDVIEDLLNLVKSDKERIKKHASENPYLYRIYSTASLSKLFYQIKYSEDYDDWKVKHGNSKFYENINEIFKEVYSGGRVEIFRHGIIKDKKIIYSDFASLYPHASYLTNIEPLMEDILNKRLKFTSDIEEIENTFWIMVDKLAKKIKNKEPLIKEDFCDSAVLNVKINNINLRLSRKASIFRGKVNTDANKRNRCDLIINKGSIVNVSNYDLCYSVLEKHLIEGLDLEELKKNIVFNKGLMVVPSYRTSKINDMHTLLYDKRSSIKNEIKGFDNIKDNEEKIKHLKSQSEFIKIVLNAGYGITAEFANDKEGQFYNPILASSITAMARLMNNLTEISTRFYGFECYYSDTDSCLMDSGGFEIVSNLFKEVCELKNELSDNVFINNMIIVGAKEYAYFTNNKDEYGVKTHGVGFRASGYKNVLDKLFRNLIDGVDKDTAIKEAVEVAPMLRNFNFSHVFSRNRTLYTGLSDTINKKSEVLGDYKIDDNVFRCYQYGKTGVFISDCDNITKGTFGLMFRLSEPKIYFFSVKYGFNEKMLKEVLENIGGIPKTDRKIILERLDSKYSESLFLNNYLGKNEDNVKRRILENGVCAPFDCDVKEDIDISFNEKALELDGVEYCGMVELPKFDFASKMQADLTAFYSKAITSISKSLSYWFTKRQNPESADEVFNKRNNELLIPQKKNEILVPLNMVEVPESEAQIKLALEERGRKKVLDKYFMKTETGGYYGLKKKVNFEYIKDELLTILKPRNTIITEVFNKKKYWFEVTSYKANNFNAVLRINVVVGNPPVLKYYLWINPRHFNSFFNVDLWNASYTDLMFSTEGLSNVVNKVFEIAYNNSEHSHGVVYNSILSGFSRGSSYSLNDLKKNNKYFLDICYSVACAFIVMNSVKHSSLKIGRLDLSKNLTINVNKDKQDLVISLLQTQMSKEVNEFLDFKSKDNFVERVRLSEEIYTASSGHYSGLVNKRTKISQIIYNKSMQLDYKLLKSCRKKSFNSRQITKFYEQKLEIERQNKDTNIWRLEVQAYGYKAIQKAVNSYDKVMKKMEKMLVIVIKLVNKIDLSEFVILKQTSDDCKDFNFWFNDLNKERVKPPLLLVT